MQAVSANPSSPLFNHYLFEAIATIMKVAVVQDCAQVEQSLIPVCNFILANQVRIFFADYSRAVPTPLLNLNLAINPLHLGDS